MINAQNLSVLLRALRQGALVPGSAVPPSAVARVMPMAMLAPDDGGAPALRARFLSSWPTPGAFAAELTKDSSVTESQGHAAPAIAAGQPASGGPTSARGMPLPAQAPGSSIDLSPGGALLRDALNTPGDARGPVVRPVAPLLSVPPHQPALLAQALQQAISRSGLFYESHVAQWAANDFPATELYLEPQAAWTAAPASGGLAPDTTLAADALLRDVAAPLVRAQLEALEARRVGLSGEVWPGQSAQLTFEAPRNACEGERDGDAPDSLAWNTRIALTLPSLGTVTALVRVTGDALECRLTASTHEAAARLTQGRDNLAAAVLRHALDLDLCTVAHDSAI